jgi:hypothetical protein
MGFVSFNALFGSADRDARSLNVPVAQPTGARPILKKLAHRNKSSSLCHALFRWVRREFSVGNLAALVLGSHNWLLMVNRPILAPRIVVKDEAGVGSRPFNGKVRLDIPLCTAQEAEPALRWTPIDLDR